MAGKKEREREREMELAHTKTVEEILQEFKVTEEDGLNNSRVEELRLKHGLNGKIETKTQWTLKFVIMVVLAWDLSIV